MQLFWKLFEHKSIILQSSSGDQGLRDTFCQRILGIPQVWVPIIAQHCCATLKELMQYRSPSLIRGFSFCSFCYLWPTTEADDTSSDRSSEGQWQLNPNSTSQCPHHSPHLISSHRHSITLHHHEKGEYNIKINFQIIFITAYCHNFSFLFLLLFISYCA